MARDEPNGTWFAVIPRGGRQPPARGWARLVDAAVLDGNRFAPGSPLRHLWPDSRARSNRERSISGRRPQSGSPPCLCRGAGLVKDHGIPSAAAPRRSRRGVRFDRRLSESASKSRRLVASSCGGGFPLRAQVRNAQILAGRGRAPQPDARPCRIGNERRAGPACRVRARRRHLTERESPPPSRRGAESRDCRPRCI